MGDQDAAADPAAPGRELKRIRRASRIEAGGVRQFISSSICAAWQNFEPKRHGVLHLLRTIVWTQFADEEVPHETLESLAALAHRRMTGAVDQV